MAEDGSEAFGVLGGEGEGEGSAEAVADDDGFLDFWIRGRVQMSAETAAKRGRLSVGVWASKPGEGEV